ncbi:DUF4892 domain-containing protein [Marinobacter sp.]|uniref:DUF4892 domain-containing protein n=1 Tax=Marinobacter sp. TaxID=50741 RepID=UPI0034A4D482
MMINSIAHRVFAGLLCLVVVNASAQEADSDLASVPEAFSQSSFELDVPVVSSGHLVLFSPVREVNNEIRSDRMARIPVRGVGNLYQIRRDSSRQDAREHYKRLLQARGAQVLFQCSSRSCGRSNVWANQIFDQATLYGRDENQDYLVAATTDSSGITWLTLVYTVKRGNQREYVWVEHLEVGEGAVIPGLDSANARVRGPIIVPWQGGITYRFEWSAEDRRMLNNWTEEEGAQVLLTGYVSLGEEESLEDAMGRANESLASLSQVLEKSGIAKDRQTLIAVGPAVIIPSPERQGDRIEIVVITR